MKEEKEIDESKIFASADATEFDEDLHNENKEEIDDLLPNNDINEKNNEEEASDLLTNETDTIRKASIKENVKIEDTNLEVTENNQKSSSLSDLLKEENPSKEKSKNTNSNHKKTSKPRYVSYENRLLANTTIFGITLFFLILFLISYLNIQTTSHYTEKAGVNYQVCLKENEYYNNSCLGENVEYLTSISDTVKIDFNYSAVYPEAQERKTNYFVQTKLLIKTVNEPEKELLSKEKEITKRKEEVTKGNVVSIVESVDIPFQEYNSYAQKYKNDYSLLSNCELIVSLMKVENSQEKELSSIVIPLTKATYNITKYDMHEQTSIYTVQSSMQLKNFFLVIVILLGIVNLYTAARLIKFISSTQNKNSEYNKKLSQILNTYDRVIITLKDNNRILTSSQPIYTVNSFLELLDVRDTIEKPILYYRVNNVKTEFYVQDTDRIYKYTLKEADFKKKNQGDL